jgi:hypothetical protein
MVALIFSIMSREDLYLKNISQYGTLRVKKIPNYYALGKANYSGLILSIIELVLKTFLVQKKSETLSVSISHLI